MTPVNNDLPRCFRRLRPASPLIARPCGSCARPGATCRNTGNSKPGTDSWRWSARPSSPPRQPCSPCGASPSMRRYCFPTSWSSPRPSARDTASRTKAASPWNSAWKPGPRSTRSRPPNPVPTRLAYVAEALALLKKELAGQKALLGFGGSPWTLASYMVEGGSSKNFSRIKALFYADPGRVRWHRPARKSSPRRSSPIFSNANPGQCGRPADFRLVGRCHSRRGTTRRPPLQWIRRIVAALPRDVSPVILFAKGATAHLGRAAGQLRRPRAER